MIKNSKLKNITKKQNKNLSQAKEEISPEAVYHGGLSLQKFQGVYLIPVGGGELKNNIYFYFNPSFIKNFDQLDLTSQTKFIFLSKPENIHFAASKNETGLKREKQAILPTCELVVNEKNSIALKFSHALKINGTDHRIGVVTLKSLQDGPQILVATHAILGGFHNKQHKGTALKSKELFKEPLQKSNSQFFAQPKKKSYFSNKIQAELIPEVPKEKKDDKCCLSPNPRLSNN